MIRKGLALFVVLAFSFLHSQMPAAADVAANAPRARLANFWVSAAMAESRRPFVYICRHSSAEIFALNADTGSFAGALKLAGNPNDYASLTLSLDETLLYVPLTDTKKLQIISLADFQTVGIIDLGISVASIAPGYDGNLYVADERDLYRVNPSQDGAHRLSEIPSYYWPLLKTDPTGRRLFLANTAVTGGGPRIYEFDISPTGLTPTAVHLESQGAADFELDLDNNRIYCSGMAGADVWNTVSRTTDYLIMDAPYAGSNVAFRPESSFVYASSATRIRRFDKATGIVDTTFNVGVMPEATLRRSLYITPEGRIFYAMLGSINVIGLASFGELPTPAPLPDPAFSAWALASSLQGANASPTADPDGDGIPNYAEFAFASDPMRAASADPTMKPTRAAIVPLNEATVLTITYPRLRPGVSSIMSYRVEAARELFPNYWRPAGEWEFPLVRLSETPIDQTNYEWVTERVDVDTRDRAAIYVRVRAVLSGQ